MGIYRSPHSEEDENSTIPIMKEKEMKKTNKEIFEKVIALSILFFGSLICLKISEKIEVFKIPSVFGMCLFVLGIYMHLACEYLFKTTQQKKSRILNETFNSGKN